VFGSLSAISSTTASNVKTINVDGWLMKASLVPAKCNQPRCAAQHTSAGGVSDRRPSTPPRRNVSKNAIIVAGWNLHYDNCRNQAFAFKIPGNERYRDFSPVESPGPMKGIYFVGVLLNRKP
jgi:hypothetical protein